MTFACKIPESTDESFYSGQVFVTFKDLVFRPSTSFWSTLELYESIQLLPSLADAKPLFMATEGGPKHNVSHKSVKTPLILLFCSLILTCWSLCALYLGIATGILLKEQRVSSTLDFRTCPWKEQQQTKKKLF